MIWRILSRGFIPVIMILAALVYWKLHAAPKVISIGYVADRDVILWNTLAQVREPVAEVHYGDRVEVIRMEGTALQLRTAAGKIGWMRDSRQMMDSDLWGKSAALLDRARKLPVEARGRTKTVSNVRVEPGRGTERIFQFARGTHVLILERAVADAASGPPENSQDEKDGAAKDSAADDQKSKQEDWFLVLRDANPTSNANSNSSPGNGHAEVKPATGDAVSGGPVASQSGATVLGEPIGPVAGWVLARFIELDLPDPVKDYASSADLRVVAWFELNRVPDGSGGEAPQYLVAASRGAEGQVCDFTMVRIYTWGAKRKRYETAYVESDLCGRLPIHISSGEKGPEFEFPDIDEGGAERKYVMSQTTVRRVKDAASPPALHKK
jgi:hypothetical protein